LVFCVLQFNVLVWNLLKIKMEFGLVMFLLILNHTLSFVATLGHCILSSWLLSLELDPCFKQQKATLSALELLTFVKKCVGLSLTCLRSYESTFYMTVELSDSRLGKSIALSVTSTTVPHPPILHAFCATRFHCNLSFGVMKKNNYRLSYIFHWICIK